MEKILGGFGGGKKKNIKAFAGKYQTRWELYRKWREIYGCEMEKS